MKSWRVSKFKCIKSVLEPYSKFRSLLGSIYYPIFLMELKTEQGVTMLSSVLKNQKAIGFNILVMQTFVKLREIIASSNFRISPIFMACIFI